MLGFSMFSPKSPTDLTKRPAFPLVDQTYKLHDYMYGDKAHKAQFDLTNTDHTLLLRDCSDMFTSKLNALKSNDYHIAIAFSVGIAAFALSFLFPVSLIMVAGLGYGLYCSALRVHLVKEYTQSLENMMLALKFSTGEVKSSTAKAVLNSSVITDLVKLLVPVATKQQLFDVIDDKVEKQLVGSAEEQSDEITFGDIKLDEEQKKLYYTLYGYEQGNMMNVLPGIGHAIVNGFNYAKNVMFAPKEEEVPTNGMSHV